MHCTFDQGKWLNIGSPRYHDLSCYIKHIVTSVTFLEESRLRPLTQRNLRSAISRVKPLSHLNRPYRSPHPDISMLWDDKTERRMLLCVLDTPLPRNWDVVAQQMGTGFTTEAVQQALLPYNTLRLPHIVSGVFQEEFRLSRFFAPSKSWLRGLQPEPAASNFTRLTI